MSWKVRELRLLAMTPLLLKLIFSEIPKRAPFLARPVAKGISAAMNKRMIDPSLASHIRYWEAELNRSAWFAGDDFTAADIMMSFPLEAAAKRAGLDASRRNVWDWLGRIHDRPAYQRALKAGGPYAYA